MHEVTDIQSAGQQHGFRDNFSGSRHKRTRHDQIVVSAIRTWTVENRTRGVSVLERHDNGVFRQVAAHPPETSVHSATVDDPWIPSRARYTHAFAWRTPDAAYTMAKTIMEDMTSICSAGFSAPHLPRKDAGYDFQVRLMPMLRQIAAAAAPQNRRTHCRLFPGPAIKNRPISATAMLVRACVGLNRTHSKTTNPATT